MINLSYNGKEFNQREDGFVNLGQLCATHGKRYPDWRRLKGADEYLAAVARSLTQQGVHIFTAENLVVSDVNAIGGDAGTWGHPLVAIEVARWISPDFGVWCNQHIKVLLETGQTSTQQQEPRQLPQRDAVEYITAAKDLQSLPDGILKALLADTLADEIALKRNNALPPIKSDYTIVKVRAKMLGYSDKQIGNGSNLGRFVRQQIEPAFQEMIGRYPVFHYEVTPELDTAIHTFFGG